MPKTYYKVSTVGKPTIHKAVFDTAKFLYEKTSRGAVRRSMRIYENTVYRQYVIAIEVQEVRGGVWRRSHTKFLIGSKGEVISKARKLRAGMVKSDYPVRYRFMKARESKTEILSSHWRTAWKPGLRRDRNYPKHPARAWRAPRDVERVHSMRLMTRFRT